MLCVALGPDGTTLFAGGKTGRTWDLAKADDAVVLRRASCGAAFSPDGKTLWWAEWQTVEAWDVAARKPREPRIAVQYRGHFVARHEPRRNVARLGESGQNRPSLGYGDRPHERQAAVRIPIA